MVLKGHAEYTTKSGREKRRISVWVDLALLNELNVNIADSGMSASGYMTWLIGEHNKHVKMKTELMTGLQDRVQVMLVEQLAQLEREKDTAKVLGKKAPKKADKKA